MLEQLGNVGEFVGAIAVVVSLVYLSLQVRQNTIQLRRNEELAEDAALESTLHHFNEYRLRIAESAELSELYLRGLSNPNALDRSERLRFNALMANMFFGLARMHRLIASGFDLNWNEEIYVDILQTPGGRRYFEDAKFMFDPAFVEHLETTYASTSALPASENAVSSMWHGRLDG